MTLDRRQLLAGTATLPTALQAAPREDAREWYVLRRYTMKDAQARAALLGHLAGAVLPAYGRAGLDRMGVFVDALKGFDVHLLLPHADVGKLITLDEAVAADGEYVEATRAWSAGGAVYGRIESRLLHAFRSIPVIEAPGKGAGWFELRTYESKNVDAARRKVLMFDEGETQLMRDVEMAPVFFGACRVGHDAPNLTYLLSAEDEEAHKAHWQAFLKHPEWDRMKVLPQYANTVSRIVRWELLRADCSQL